MDAQIRNALEKDRVIDITTIGRRTGQPHRIEIWFHNINGSLYITGRPGRKRDWYRNMVAHPDFTFHLKKSAQADIPATATPITDPAKRHEVLAAILTKLDNEASLDEWVQGSPLVAVTLKAAWA